MNSVETANHIPFRRRTGTILIGILLLSAFLRLYKFGQSPPGLNQDEAANAWNAYCLLKTGKDQVGVSWPIFYMHALGGNRTTPYIYLILPFQAIGGMNVFATRLPAALVGGVLAVFVTYFTVKRLFDEKTALVAAALLAVNPWHLQLTRWGHEASLVPLLGLAALAMLLLTGMPISDRTNKPNPLLAFLAGAIIGICCYGHHPVRIFIPIFIFFTVIVTLPGWWRLIKTRNGIISVAALILGLVFTLSPMAWMYIFHPEGIARHGKFQVFLFRDYPFLVALKEFAIRYISHFSPDFLFIHGDPFAIQSLPGIGQFHWYMLPLLIFGLISLFLKLRSSYTARVLVVFLLVYPISDSLFAARGVNSQRCASGLCGFIILAAVGAVAAYRLLAKKYNRLAVVSTVLFTVSFFYTNIAYLHRFYGKYNSRPEIYHIYNVDLIEACQWLRSRMDEYDGIFFTVADLNQPYIITLIALNYAPEQWFSQERVSFCPGEWDYYTKYGKMHFMYDGSFMSDLAKLRQQKQLSKVLLIVRPGELEPEQITHKIYRPDGEESLWLCEYLIKGE